MLASVAEAGTYERVTSGAALTDPVERREKQHKLERNEHGLDAERQDQRANCRGAGGSVVRYALCLEDVDTERDEQKRRVKNLVEATARDGELMGHATDDARHRAERRDREHQKRDQMRRENEMLGVESVAAGVEHLKHEGVERN